MISVTSSSCLLKEISADIATICIKMFLNIFQSNVYCSFFFLQNPLIPSEHRMKIIDYFVMVHKVIEVYSRKFQLRLRRNNYVTPKNYLDFISTYLKLLDEKDKFIQSQVRKTFNYSQWKSTDAVLGV